MFILTDSKISKLFFLIRLEFYMFITKSVKNILYEILKNLYFSEIQNLMVPLASVYKLFEGDMC